MTAAATAPANCYERRPAVFHTWGDDDRCISCGTAYAAPAGELTPAARIARIADLAQDLPAEDAPHLSLGRNEEAFALVAGLPGAWLAKSIRYAQTQIGRCIISAFGDRGKLPGEPPIVLPAGIPLADGISPQVLL